MQRARQYLLAAAGLALDQHMDAAVHEPARLRDQLLHRGVVIARDAFEWRQTV
ncbi:hypothetical protein D9M69_728510 [compost metagenome]